MDEIAAGVSYEDCPGCFKRVGFLMAVSEYIEKDSVKAREFFQQVVSKDGVGLTAIPAATRTYLFKARGSNGGLAKEDYEKTLQLIHNFHAGMAAPKKLTGREGWDF